MIKNPTDIFSIKAVLAAFPDAMIIQTHRDPAKTLPSQASLIVAMRRLIDPDCDARTVGPTVVDVWRPAFANAVANRRNPAIAARIFDIAYAIDLNARQDLGDDEESEAAEHPMDDQKTHSLDHTGMPGELPSIMH